MGRGQSYSDGFSICFKPVEYGGAEIIGYGDILKNYSERIDVIRRNMRGKITGADNIGQRLQKISESVDMESRDAEKMGQALNEILRKYRNAEKAITEKGVEGNSISEPGATEGNYGPMGEEELEEALKDYDASMESQDSVGDYVGDALKQAILGEWVDDGNGLGIILSVVIGCIPYVGQVADIRDICAALYNMRDGADTKEKLSLALSLIAFVPVFGDILKHTDELEPILRNLDDIVDGLGDFGRQSLRSMDEFVSVIRVPIDRIEDKLDKVKDGISEQIHKLAEKAPTFNMALEQVGDFLDKKFLGDNTFGDVLDECTSDFLEIEDKFEETAAGIIDSFCSLMGIDKQKQPAS